MIVTPLIQKGVYTNCQQSQIIFFLLSYRRVFGLAFFFILSQSIFSSVKKFIFFFDTFKSSMSTSSASQRSFIILSQQVLLNLDLHNNLFLFL